MTIKRLNKKTSKPKKIQAPKFSQLERIAKLGNDYGSMLNQQTARGLYAHYGTMTMEELASKLKSKTLTALERSVIVHIAKISANGKDALQAIQYLHDRTFGKVENKTEISGVNGGPVQVESKVDIDSHVAKMSDEELAIFEESISKIEAVLGNNLGNENQ